MKNIFKSFMVAIAAVSMLAACADKVESTLDPYATNFVYLRAPIANSHKATFSTSGNWKSKPDSISSYIQILCTKPAPQDIKVNLEIDESMVETYNTANGTDYQLLSQVKLLQNELVIKRGNYLTTDTLKTVITDYAPIVEAGTQNYIVPIKITNTTSGVVSEQNHFYVFYQASMLFAQLRGDYTGTQLDRSGWKIYQGDFGTGKDVTSILADGDKYSDIYNIYNKTSFSVDLGQVYDNLVCFGLEHYGYYSSYSCSELTVEISEDGKDFKSLGTYDAWDYGKAVLETFDPQRARYVKFTGDNFRNSYYGWDVAEINISVAE